MKIKFLLFSLLALGIAVIIPLFFRESLFFMVGSMHLGWLVSTVLLRLAVILFVAFFLHYLFKLLMSKRRIRFIWTFLIALLPGFGLSFIYPIYNIDYGMLSDDFKMTGKSYLDEKMTKQPLPEGYALYAFFTTTCPHCKEASERLGTNIRGGQEVAVNILFPSTPEDAQKFLAEHNGEAFNYGLIDSDSAFITISGGSFPSIFLVDNAGNTTHHWTGDELNYTTFDYLKSL